MQKRYRDCQNQNEIKNLLARSSGNYSSITLWQNNVKSRRVVEATVKNVDKNTIQFEIKDKNKKFYFSKQKDIYIANTDELFAFKANILKMTRNLIVTDVPELMKAIDKREKIRKEFNFFTNFKSTIQTFNIYGTQSNSFRLKIYDISENGIGVYIPPQRISRFHMNDVVIITEIHGHGLEVPLEGTITHLTPIRVRSKLRTQNFYRCGILFKKHLQRGIFAFIDLD